MAEFTDCSGYYVPAEVDEKLATMQAEIDELNSLLDRHLEIDDEINVEKNTIIKRYKQALDDVIEYCTCGADIFANVAIDEVEDFINKQE